MDKSCFISLLKRLKRRIVKDKWEEQRKCFGLHNMTKHFYVIRSSRAETGLMSCHNYILHHIRYALIKGYIPVVDMQNYPNMYLDEHLLHKVNSWEYYFKQPMGYSLKEVYRSCNVTLSSNQMDKGYYGIEDNADIIVCNEVIKKYLCLNEEMQREVEAEKEKLGIFKEGNRVLGVCCRGTDYITLHPSKHAIPLTADESIVLVKEKMREWKCECIYLATEDEGIYKAFYDAFKGHIYSVDCPRFNSNTEGKYLAQMSFQRENDKYLRGVEYLKTVYLLACCTSIITPTIAGGLAAIRINGNKYENVMVVDNGIYK